MKYIVLFSNFVLIWWLWKWFLNIKQRD